MKLIKYTLRCTRTTKLPTGIVATDDYAGPTCTLHYSEPNLSIAQAEAWPDTLEIVDDGQPEPEVLPSAEDTLLDLAADHEYRLSMLEIGGE